MLTYFKYKPDKIKKQQIIMNNNVFNIPLVINTKIDNIINIIQNHQISYTGIKTSHDVYLKWCHKTYSVQKEL